MIDPKELLKLADVETEDCGTSFARANCIDCDKLLTLEEQHYYSIRCHKCEDVWSTRLAEWMAGKEDPELDAMFTVKLI